VPLRFERHQSWFVVFRRPVTDTVPVRGSNFPAVSEVGVVAGPWDVLFDQRWGGPGTVAFDELYDSRGREPVAQPPHRRRRAPQGGATHEFPCWWDPACEERKKTGAQPSLLSSGLLGPVRLVAEG
jgi:hypothetical protein